MAFTYFARYLTEEDELADRRAHAEQAVARLRPQLRIVRVVTRPAGATVYLDTLERGAFGRTPVEVALQPDEAHTLLLRREGFVDATERVAADTTGDADVMVELAPRTGSLTFDVEPAHALVRVLRGSRLVVAAEGDGALELPVGGYRVRVEAPGHTADERLLVVGEGAEQALRVALAPIPARTALLLVSAGGVPGRVELDGRRVGRVPLRLPGVLAGRRRVEVHADDGRVWTGTLELAAGDARHARARFRN